MTDMHTMMTQPPLDTAANSLCCAFIYMKDRTDLTPEERADLGKKVARSMIPTEVV